MLDADVLVVGAGPAGLSAAWAAARVGARTLVVDRNREVGTPIRTSGASWFRDLARLGIPAAFGHPLHSLRFIAPRREARWSFTRPVACVLDVSATYRYLADRAVGSGAVLELHRSVVGVIQNDRGGRVEGVRVRTGGRAEDGLRAAVTIDATGSASAVSTWAGLHPPFTQFGVGAEIELQAPEFGPFEGMLLVGRTVAPQGYAWAFPGGAGRVRIGVGILRPEGGVRPRLALDPLLHHPAIEPRLRGAEVLEEHLGVLATRPLQGALSQDGLIAVGDAAGQASPLVGEGIRYVIEAGRLAGAVAAAAVAQGTTSREFLRGYDRAWHRRWGREMRLAHWLNRRLVRYGDRNWRVVGALGRHLSGDEVAAFLHGDFFSRTALSVGLRSPSLIAAALKAIGE